MSGQRGHEHPNHDPDNGPDDNPHNDADNDPDTCTRQSAPGVLTPCPGPRDDRAVAVPAQLRKIADHAPPYPGTFSTGTTAALAIEHGPATSAGFGADTAIISAAIARPIAATIDLDIQRAIDAAFGRPETGIDRHADFAIQRSAIGQRDQPCVPA
jgi:hypothetical protein